MGVGGWVVCMQVCTCIRMCGCRCMCVQIAHVSVYMWRPEGDVSACLLPFHRICPGKVSCLNTEPFDEASLARQGSSLCLPGTGISGGHPSDLPGASVGSGDLNSSPHACLTTVSPTYLLSHCPLLLSGSWICILTGLEFAS